MKFRWKRFVWLCAVLMASFLVIWKIVLSKEGRLKLLFPN